MPRANFNGTVIAESDTSEIVEGNAYYPPDSMKAGHFRPTGHTTFHGWKGTAGSFSVAAGGELVENAAWIYHDPKPEASSIKDFVAFYPFVMVER